MYCRREPHHLHPCCWWGSFLSALPGVFVFFLITFVIGEKLAGMDNHAPTGIRIADEWRHGARAEAVDRPVWFMIARGRPCDTCPHYQHCEDTGDTCRAFESWASTGKENKYPRDPYPWAPVDNLPGRSNYSHTYRHDPYLYALPYWGHVAGGGDLDPALRLYRLQSHPAVDPVVYSDWPSHWDMIERCDRAMSELRERHPRQHAALLITYTLHDGALATPRELALALRVNVSYTLMQAHEHLRSIMAGGDE